jgi:conjugal transfer pilus assembly protein TraB
MKELLKKWEDLDPKKKQKIIIVLIIVVFISIIYSYASNNDRSLKKRNIRTEKISTDILTGRDTSNLGIEGNQVQIKNIRGEQARFNTAFESFKLKIEDDLSKQDTKLLQSKIIQMSAEQKQLQRQIKDQLDAIVDIRDSLNQQGLAIIESTGSSDQVTPSVVDRTLWQEQEVTPFDDKEIPGNETANKQNTLKITVISGTSNTTGKDNSEDEGETIFIPAGTILSGTLITGMDAPTNETTKSNPFPALLRIKDDAILPNRFRMDIKECFIIASGYGDISSERAYLRGETISCINYEEEVLEASIDLYGVGEDGKAGLRGRMVSKTGQVLSRAMMAGFMESISDAFRPQQVGAISVIPGDDAQFQNMVTGDSVKSAGLAGISNAAKTLSDYYISLAEGIHPVIEIDAGRKIDMIVKKGMKLIYRKTN